MYSYHWVRSPASIFKILIHGLVSRAGLSRTCSFFASASKAPPRLAEFLLLMLRTQLLLLPWTKWPTLHLPAMARISSAFCLTCRMWQTLSPWNDRGWEPPKWRAGKEVLLQYEVGHTLCGGVHSQAPWTVKNCLFKTIVKNCVFLLWPLELNGQTPCGHHQTKARRNVFRSHFFLIEWCTFSGLWWLSKNVQIEWRSLLAVS